MDGSDDRVEDLYIPFELGLQSGVTKLAGCPHFYIWGAESVEMKYAEESKDVRIHEMSDVGKNPCRKCPSVSLSSSKGNLGIINVFLSFRIY